MISYNQPYELVCPTCQQPFVADMWLIVDAEERPDLVQAIRAITLHDATCPHCQQSGVVPAPLLYHDRVARKVLFGVPHGMDEDEWRELAQGLLWMLIGALPREQQLPYLGDVQAEAGVAGVAEMLDYLVPTPQSAAEALGDALGSDDPDEVPPLAQAMVKLMEVQTPAEFQQLLHEFPFLLDDAMDEGLAGLAEAATDQGEFEIGQAFERARLTLIQLRQTLSQAPSPPAATSSATLNHTPPPANWREIRDAALKLDETTSLEQLRTHYPELNDPQADAWFAADEQALRERGDLAAAQVLQEIRAVLRGERD